MKTSLTLALYGRALRLYPRNFRERYAAEMLAVARRQQQDAPGQFRFTLGLFTDTVRSLMEEHMRATSSPKLAYVIGFAAFFSAVLLVVSVFHQQTLRRGADRAPRQMVATLGDQLARGDRSSLGASGATQDIGSDAWLQSNFTFAAVYDAAGNAVASNATLHGALPQPPHGIFNNMREREVYKVTWQPQPGVRVALTGRQIARGGYVVAGQSLIPSEARDAAFSRILRWLWVALVAGCAIIALLARGRARLQL